MPEIPKDVIVHSYANEDRQPGMYFPGRVMRDQVRHLSDLIDAHEIDVIYDRTFQMTMIAGAAAKAKNIPRISTIVSPPDRALPLVEKRFTGLKRRRLAAAYRMSHKVIAVSRQSAVSAIQYYSLPDSLVDVIANPVDRDVLLSCEDPKIQRVGKGTTLVCVGRMTPEKGHADLIEALRLTESRWQGEPIDVWLIGDGPLRSSLEKMASEKLSRHRVHFKGHQPKAAPWIAASDGLVLPSLFEGMPNVVLEAMAMKKPVIATASGGTVELQGDTPTMFTAQPGNPASLADAIMKFQNEPNTCLQHTRAATERIMQNHDVRKTTRRIEALLVNAANPDTANR